MTLHAIIDDLYEGTLDQAVWSRAIRNIANLVDGASAMIFGIESSEATVFRQEPHGLEMEILDEFGALWADKEIRLAPALRLPVFEPIFDSRLLPMSLWKRSEIYNDFLLRIDRPWILSFWLEKQPGKSTLFTIHGSRRRGPLDEADARLIQPLLPHLRRAQEIRSRLEQLDLRAHTLKESWQHLTFGVTILDERGRILEANVVAEDLIRCTPGIDRRPDGSLRLDQPAGSQLDAYLATGMPATGSNGLLHLPRVSALPLSIMVTRLPFESTLWIRGAPRWMLLWFDPDRSIADSAHLIQVELELSAREAEVAALLASGYDTQGISERMEVSLHTVHSHVKSCLAKTGSRTRAQLLQRILTGASRANRK